MGKRNKNKPSENWLMANYVDNEELYKFISCGEKIIAFMKGNKFSQYQAKQLLEYIKVCLDEQPV